MWPFAFCHPITSEPGIFGEKRGFWTDSSDSCTVRALVGACPEGHRPGLWFDGQAQIKTPEAWQLPSLSPRNPISESFLSRGKWKHSGLKFPRRLQSFIKSIFLFHPLPEIFWDWFLMARPEVTQQFNVMPVGCKYTPGWQSHHYVNPPLSFFKIFFKGHPDNEHRLARLCDVLKSLHHPAGSVGCRRRWRGGKAETKGRTSAPAEGHIDW